jgi:glutamate carboxypeptidase
MIRAIDDQAPAANALLEELVNINSGTFNPAGVTQVAKMMEAELRALGFETRLLPMDSVKRAPSLVAEHKGNRGKRILINGHMDTVFETSSPFQKFVRDGDRATGPGTADMKSGLVIILSALKALQHVGALDNATITVFLTGDEENPGTPWTISRQEFIEAAKRSDAFLCFETGAQQDGKDFATTGRRGLSIWEVRVEARTGHSAGIFSEQMGHGAAFELSRILSQFHDTLREANMTYSVGLVLSGENIKMDPGGAASVEGKANIVPAEARAVGEVRALTMEQLAHVKEKMRAIVDKSLPGTKAEIDFSSELLPMPPTPGNAALLAKLNEVNRAMGLPPMEALDPMLRGAGDAGFVAPYVDSLDGLGGVGRGAHAPGESVNLARQALQSKRAALLIYRLIQEEKSSSAIWKICRAISPTQVLLATRAFQAWPRVWRGLRVGLRWRQDIESSVDHARGSKSVPGTPATSTGMA